MVKKIRESKGEKTTRRDWHRLFGMFVTAHFENSPYQVEVEKDLTVKKQLIDVTVVRREAAGNFDRYPDGLENMAEHNLLSYKSLHESFTVWSLLELGGHYVNYRKQVSPSFDELIPQEQFRLYGITTHEPVQLIKTFNPKKISEGVWELQWEEVCIRLIVLPQIPKGPHNDLWRLFSARADIVEEARTHYETCYQDSEHSVLMQMLYEYYLKEKLPMTYTRQQFEEDFVLAHLKSVSPEKILKQYSPEEVLKQYSPEQLLKGFSPEQRIQIKALLNQKKSNDG
jgi:hypothetical protein